MESSQPHASVESLLATNTLPSLGPGPRPGVSDPSTLLSRVETYFASHPQAAPRKSLAQALVLLWHDHLTASHEISQQIHNADGSYVHGIMHRREPDYGNAAYWFRKVGNHAAYAELAQRAHRLLEERQAADLVSSVTPGGQWDPFAFIDLCESVAGRGVGEEEGLPVLLREIQALEFEVLLQRFCK